MFEKTCLLQEKFLQGILISFLKLMPYVLFVLNTDDWNEQTKVLLK